MPRSRRKILQGVTYHTYSFCHNSIPMLDNVLYKEILSQVILKTQQKYRFRLENYSIEDRRLHLIIHTLTGGAEISRIMQYIKSRFAEIYNKMHERTGSFWNSRYKDEILEEFEDFDGLNLRLLWNISMKSIVSPRSKNFEGHPYSGISVYLTGVQSRGTPVISFSKAFLNLGHSHKERVKRFKEFLKGNRGQTRIELIKAK
jgi:REP element-mobilizing transposase RayT